MTPPPHDDPTLQIRPALPEDAELICDMIHELAAYERQPEDCHATPDGLRAQLFPPHGPPPAEVVVAHLGPTPVGFALYFFNFSTWECAPGLYLEDVYVRPPHRRRGVGLALLAHLARLAVDRGCRRFELSVLDWNRPAIDFYTALGARPLDDWTVHRLEGDALRELAKAHLP